MMKFYVNKYPMFDGWHGDPDNEKPKHIPVGTVFIIDCINGNGFEMKPIDKRKGFRDSYFIEHSMLATAFNETDYLPQPEGK